MSAPTIIVELIKKVGIRRFPGRKPEQPWRWIVRDAGNHLAFERPTERYSEERGALSAIEQVHGPDATVILRRAGHFDRVLRRPYPHIGLDGTTIIGPECFATADGSVLCWKGVNYTPQRKVDVGNAPAKPGSIQAIFRVIREKVSDQTVRVLLEPYRDDQRVNLTEGDEFITGTLAVDPWGE